MKILFGHKGTRSEALPRRRWIRSSPGSGWSGRLLPLQGMELFDIGNLHRRCGIVLAHLRYGGRLGYDFRQAIRDLRAHELKIMDTVSVGSHCAGSNCTRSNLRIKDNKFVISTLILRNENIKITTPISEDTKVRHRHVIRLGAE